MAKLNLFDFFMTVKYILNAQTKKFDRERECIGFFSIFDIL